MKHCFNSLNTKDLYIRPSKMPLNNKGRITSCAKLNCQPDIELKIANTKLNPRVCVLSATTTASEN